MQRLRHLLRDYFPAALEAFEDLDAPDTLELLGRAPDPASAARLTATQISAALKRAHRRGTARKAEAIQAALRAEHLGQPDVVTAAYAASARALIAVLGTLNEQVTTLQGQVEAYFGQHPDAEILNSQPGLGPVLGARVLAETGDDPGRYASAKSRKNYAGTSPITRASGRKKTVLARYVHNDRLIDTLLSQAFSALRVSPGGTRLLRPPARPRRWAQSRPPPTRQPPRRHPARLPQNPHPLQRSDRMAATRAIHQEDCGLTLQLLGCLSADRACR